MAETKKRTKTNRITRIRGKKKLNENKGVDTFKYCGAIKLKEDPLAIQKRLRNEW